MTSELRRVLDFIYVRPIEWACSLLSEHELEKHDKVAWDGLTRPLLGSWTAILIAIFFEVWFGAQAIDASTSHEISHMRRHYSPCCQEQVVLKGLNP